MLPTSAQVGTYFTTMVNDVLDKPENLAFSVSSRGILKEGTVLLLGFNISLLSVIRELGGLGKG